MLLMSNGLHILGLNFGSPRRTMLGAAPYASGDWQPLLIEAALGGIILGISGLLFYFNIVATIRSKATLVELPVMPVAEPLEPRPVPAFLDTWRPWIAITVVLILIAYGPVLYDLISNIGQTSPGFKLW